MVMCNFLLAYSLGFFFEKGIKFYNSFWMSQKSRRPIICFGGAEILDILEAIDKGNVLKRSLSILFEIAVTLSNALDSRDLFTHLPTQRNLINGSASADADCIRYKFEVKNVIGIICIPGKVKFTDPETKTDISITPDL